MCADSVCGDTEREFKRKILTFKFTRVESHESAQHTLPAQTYFYNSGLGAFWRGMQGATFLQSVINDVISDYFILFVKHMVEGDNFFLNY